MGCRGALLRIDIQGTRSRNEETSALGSSPLINLKRVENPQHRLGQQEQYKVSEYRMKQLGRRAGETFEVRRFQPNPQPAFCLNPDEKIGLMNQKIINTTQSF